MSNKTVQSGQRPRTGARVALASLALLAATMAPAQAAPAPPYQPAAPIEATYHAPGPWTVAERTGLDCCTSTGDSYDIWYPADLGAGGVTHPVITWGNGTMADPQEYAYLLSHLASWGFVVIAADRTDTGTGIQLLDAVRYLTRENSDPNSIFGGKIDTGAVGATGHSQGGLGAFNALARGDGAVSTAVTLEMPMAVACASLPTVDGQSTCIDPTAVTAGSVLLVNGSADGISPATQALPPEVIGMQSMQAYYDAIPADLPKARAAVVGAQHNDIQGQPHCTNLSCTEGVHRYLGYLTAWFMDRLRGDALARGAFLADTGELLHNPYWSDQASTITR